MTDKITRIARNTSYFTFALILQKALSFTYFILIARAIGIEDLGKYYFAISFTTIFAIFIDLGLSNVLTREVAKKNNNSQNLLNTVLTIKIPLAVLSLLSVFVLINLMNYPEITRHLVYLSAICMILDSFTLTFFSTMRGFHNLKFESISVILFQVIVLTCGLSVLYFGLGLRLLMLVMVIASSFNFIYSISLIKLKWKIKLLPYFNARQFESIKTIIKITIPFSLFAIFQKLYMYLDTVLLSVLAGDRYVGLYQIAFKIVFALQFLPMAFMASLYPAFASYWNNNKQQLVISFERAMNYLIIISLPISAGTIMLSDKIVLLFRPDYVEAILPLQIIMIALFFIFINFPIGSLLNACDKQKINTIHMGIALAVSIIMNLILIPKFQTAGAAITVIATNFLMFILGIRYIPKIIKYNYIKILKTFLKVLISILFMSLLILLLKPILNIFIIIILGGFVYFTMLFLLGGFNKDDIMSIFGSFLKNKK